MKRYLKLSISQEKSVDVYVTIDSEDARYHNLFQPIIKASKHKEKLIRNVLLQTDTDKTVDTAGGLIWTGSDCCWLNRVDEITEEEAKKHLMNELVLMNDKLEEESK